MEKRWGTCGRDGRNGGMGEVGDMVEWLKWRSDGRDRRGEVNGYGRRGIEGCRNERFARWVICMRWEGGEKCRKLDRCGS